MTGTSSSYSVPRRWQQAVLRGTFTVPAAAGFTDSGLSITLPDTGCIGWRRWCTPNSTGPARAA